jgi:hypothetical protein
VEDYPTGILKQKYSSYKIPPAVRLKSYWRNNMAIIASSETQIMQNPQRFAMAEPTKLVTFIKGEPPVNSGRGRRRNPVITEIYASIITHRNEWAHVNVPITSKKQLGSIRTSLYIRAQKDNLSLSTASVFNERTKMYDLWVMLTN